VRIKTSWFLQDRVILGVPQNTAFIDVSVITIITCFVSGRMFVSAKIENIVLFFIFTTPVGVTNPKSSDWLSRYRTKRGVLDAWLKKNKSFKWPFMQLLPDLNHAVPPTALCICVRKDILWFKHYNISTVLIGIEEM
jgi:hypothetical protein